MGQGQNLAISKILATIFFLQLFYLIRMTSQYAQRTLNEIKGTYSQLDLCRDKEHFKSYIKAIESTS